jgi:hypothetical protein
MIIKRTKQSLYQPFHPWSRLYYLSIIVIWGWTIDDDDDGRWDVHPPYDGATRSPSHAICSVPSDGDGHEHGQYGHGVWLRSWGHQSPCCLSYGADTTPASPSEFHASD